MAREDELMRSSPDVVRITPSHGGTKEGREMAGCVYSTHLSIHSEQVRHLKRDMLSNVDLLLR